PAPGPPARASCCPHPSNLSPSSSEAGRTDSASARNADRCSAVSDPVRGWAMSLSIENSVFGTPRRLDPTASGPRIKRGIFGSSGRAPMVRVRPRLATAPRRGASLAPIRKPVQALRRSPPVAVVMAVTAVLLPIPATPLPALADPQDEESSPPLVVESITPEAIDEDSTLRVNGEVTNTTSEDFEDVTVRIRYSRHPFTSRDELDEFASGDGWQPNASGPKKD